MTSFALYKHLNLCYCVSQAIKLSSKQLVRSMADQARPGVYPSPVGREQVSQVTQILRKLADVDSANVPVAEHLDLPQLSAEAGSLGVHSDNPQSPMVPQVERPANVVGNFEVRFVLSSCSWFFPLVWKLVSVDLLIDFYRSLAAIHLERLFYMWLLC